jgi:hypothetical protein
VQVHHRQNRPPGPRRAIRGTAGVKG